TSWKAYHATEPIDCACRRRHLTLTAMMPRSSEVSKAPASSGGVTTRASVTQRLFGIRAEKPGSESEIELAGHRLAHLLDIPQHRLTQARRKLSVDQRGGGGRRGSALHL